MTKPNKIIKILLTVFLVLVLIGGAVFLTIHHKNQIQNKKLEARFDKFMEYHYPYLENITKAADIYRRMQISLMYDYIKNNKGRYINETVPYYDGGYFSMRDAFKVEEIIQRATNLYVSSSSLPMRKAMEGTPRSRHDESFAWFNIIWTAKELGEVNIYDNENKEHEKAKQVEDAIDSLYIVIRNNMLSLSKYKNSSKQDLNFINKAELDLNNY